MEKRLRRINSRFDVFCFSPLISAAWVFWDENQICTGNYATCPAIWTQLWESNPLSRGYEPCMIFRFTQLQCGMSVSWTNAHLLCYFYEGYTPEWEMFLGLQ